MFAGKKFVLIIAGNITPRAVAHTGAIIGSQFGRKVPDMVGRDQEIPVEPSSTDAPAAPRRTRTHMGITTQNLPVLNGLDFDSMRRIRQGLVQETDLIMTEVTEAVATAADYQAYAQAVRMTPPEQTNYWGIGVFGDEAKINAHTEGLRLYDKQPRINDDDPGSLQGRLQTERTASLPSVRMVLANNISGGLVANAATILGASLAKFHGDALFGPDMTDHDNRTVLGLPQVDLAVLSGGSAKKPQAMRELRETLHSHPGLATVDVSDITGRTRSYPDYLEEAERTPVNGTVYYGIGASGPRVELDEVVQPFPPYISSTQETAEVAEQQRQAKLLARQQQAGGGKKKEKKGGGPQGAFFDRQKKGKQNGSSAPGEDATKHDGNGLVMPADDGSPSPGKGGPGKK